MQITVRGKQIEIGPHPVGTRLRVGQDIPALGIKSEVVTVVRPNPAKRESNGPTPEWSAIQFDDGGRLCAYTANLSAVA